MAKATKKGNRPLSSLTRFAGSMSLALLLLTIACGKREPEKTAAVSTPSPAATAENYPSLVAQAQEVNDAFRRRDFGRMVDLTYPKVIEAAGGRDKMIASLAKGLQEMEADGVTVLSSTAEAPIQIVHVSDWIYAVVPTTLKVKAQAGTFKTESSMVGISSDHGANWTFIDAGGKDHKQLLSILPAPADGLKLPADKEPLKISDN
jgi:hypothetical protein